MPDFVGPVAVLVVDDEEPIRNALKKFMTQQQFEVYTAASGEEALAQLQRHRIALMLCDIRMPGTSGVDLVPHALEAEPDLAILMLTAINDATSAALFMQRGAMDYLTKPVELADLGRAVQRALKRREMQLENRQLSSWLKEEVTTRTAELHRERMRLERISTATLEALVNALEAKDPYLRGHSARVASARRRSMMRSAPRAPARTSSRRSRRSSTWPLSPARSSIPKSTKRWPPWSRAGGRWCSSTTPGPSRPEKPNPGPNSTPGWRSGEVAVTLRPRSFPLLCTTGDGGLFHRPRFVRCGPVPKGCTTTSA